ncbi:hypothetical protein LTR97_000628 [Elasticomyces elasticus]|uniref:Uncharacterized protein n=1 Tax=Elasticomyces elasticus TaxID=574655 RepID=A0AAN7WHJ6_9PEZI|nr:hypothetical protein LTR97_000628 [Elasticomyces elasticus]
MDRTLGELAANVGSYPLTEANLIAHNQQMGNADNNVQVFVAAWLAVVNGQRARSNSSTTAILHEWLANDSDRLGYWMSHGGR